jgi:hypothetical protein
MIANLDALQSLSDVGHQRQQRPQAVRPRDKDNDSDIEGFEVLLVFQVLVNREEDIEFGFSQR